MYYNDDEHTAFGRFVIAVMQVIACVIVIVFMAFLFFRYAT